ncbi:hypothetical protein IG193_00440 [Infirmifilum lucidum]|uniref:Uncharacterized protein n=1 Tax=Infirmifilum lucidum TaxID=2776706 RepID=A0A7L9FGT6_9CREN|nr:hypothetical protein [Infirmifilum lucidum]QOJ78969.1 hypothetical protein IG193_00440 [Infirmifilum lucidum]
MGASSRGEWVSTEVCKRLKYSEGYRIKFPPKYLTPGTRVTGKIIVREGKHRAALFISRKRLLGETTVYSKVVGREEDVLFSVIEEGEYTCSLELRPVLTASKRLKIFAETAALTALITFLFITFLLILITFFFLYVSSFPIEKLGARLTSMFLAMFLDMFLEMLNTIILVTLAVSTVVGLLNLVVKSKLEENSCVEVSVYVE